MCVICRKAKGVKLPPASVIQAMWDHNPDGAGLMWREGRKVAYAKGFMEREQFLKMIEDNRSELDDTECAIHFRITTHGGTNQMNCHPFPLDKGTNPHALKGRCKRVMMHNGVMPITPRADKFSDTAEYAMRAKESGDVVKYIKSTQEWVAQSNRLCVFLPGETLLIGDWKKREDDECDYSNLNFEASKFLDNYRYRYGDGALTSFGYGDELKDRDSWGNYGYWNHDYFWSKWDQCWKDGSGRPVDIYEVDPSALTNQDEEIYYAQLAELEEMEGGCDWYAGAKPAKAKKEVANANAK